MGVFGGRYLARRLAAWARVNLDDDPESRALGGEVHSGGAGRGAGAGIGVFVLLHRDWVHCEPLNTTIFGKEKIKAEHKNMELSFAFHSFFKIKTEKRKIHSN